MADKGEAVSHELIERQMVLVKKGYHEGKCNTCEREHRPQPSLFVKNSGVIGERICSTCAGD